MHWYTSMLVPRFDCRPVEPTDAPPSRIATTSGDVMNDMLGGQLDYAMMEPVFSTAQARQGRLRILGVSSAQRLQAAPDLAEDRRLRHEDVLEAHVPVVGRHVEGPEHFLDPETR